MWDFSPSFASFTHVNSLIQVHGRQLHEPQPTHTNPGHQLPQHPAPGTSILQIITSCPAQPARRAEETAVLVLEAFIRARRAHAEHRLQRPRPVLHPGRASLPSLPLPSSPAGNGELKGEQTKVLPLIARKPWRDVRCI